MAEPKAWRALRDSLYRKDWIVYAKPPFGGAKHVFRYLGRYTHRVAIANQRIVKLTERDVTFTLKEYRNGGRRSRMTLNGVEFLRRFLLHVFPKGLVRIRHYGLYAARNVRGKLETARALLQPMPSPTHKARLELSPLDTRPWWERFLEHTGIDIMACPRCQTGRLIRTERVPMIPAHPRSPPERSHETATQ
jgi:hypothetical protein